MSTRSNTVIVGLVAAIVIPKVQRLGVTLTADDVADLMALAFAGFHAGAVAFERYFPPPQQPQAPAVAPSPPAVTGKGC